jgi:hypothetical protein
MFLLLSFLASAVAFDFGNVRNLRNILGVHAIASTVYQQIQEEMLQHQFDVLVLSDNKLHIETFLKDNSVSLIGIFIAIMGYNLYHSPNSSLTKLQTLIEYNNLKRPVRFVIFVFVFVFLRDIQNAI